MVEVRQTERFAQWLQDLRDLRARAKVQVRIERLIGGNPGDVRPIGSGISELRIDYGPGYISRRFAKACKALGLKHIRTRPYTPQTNGKVERFIQTLCKEWAYSMPFQNSVERNLWLPRYLSIYNRLRKHSALCGRSPQQRLDELLC